MTPLDAAHQATLNASAHRNDIVAAIQAAGYPLELNNLAGFQTADDEAAPLIEALIDNESAWLPFAAASTAAAVQARYDALIAAGRTITFAGTPFVFGLDDTSRNLMMQAWIFGQIGTWPVPGFLWVDQNNAGCLMSKADFDVFCINVTTYFVAAWLCRRALTDAANAAATVAALDALDLAAGWPSNP